MKKSTTYFIGAAICLLACIHFAVQLSTIPIKIVHHVENYFLWTETYYMVNPNFVLLAVVVAILGAVSAGYGILALFSLLKEVMETPEKKKQLPLA